MFKLCSSIAFGSTMFQSHDQFGFIVAIPGHANAIYKTYLFGLFENIWSGENKFAMFEPWANHVRNFRHVCNRIALWQFVIVCSKTVEKRMFEVPTSQ